MFLGIIVPRQHDHRRNEAYLKYCGHTVSAAGPGCCLCGGNS